MAKKSASQTNQIQKGYEAFIHESNNWHFLTSLLAVMLFLVMATALPIQDSLLNSLFPKRASEAAGTLVVSATRIYVPINFSSTDIIREADFQINVSGGQIVEMLCGGKDFVSQPVTGANRCKVLNEQQGSNTLVAGVIVEAANTGTLSVGASGTLTNIDGVPQQALFSSVSYEIVAPNAITLNSNVVIPISFTASEQVNAADFTAQVLQGGTLVRLSCGGAGFVDSGISTGTQCVIYNRVEPKTSGIIATALVRATTAGPLRVKGTGVLSTQAGRTPATYAFNEFNYTVINVGTTPPTQTPTPTGVQPTVTPSRTPTPTTGQATVTPTRTPSPTVPAATNTPVPTGTTVTPTPTTGNLTLVKAINMNGSAVTVDSVTYEAETSSGIQVSTTAQRFNSQSVTLNPAVSNMSKASMIRSSVWGNNGALTAQLPLTNGTYQVVIYNWEDTTAQTIGVQLEGSNVASNINTGSVGSWRALGPYTVTVNDGTLNIGFTGGDANFSGLEIWKTGSTQTGNRGDFNNDGRVDVFDIGMFAANYEVRVESNSPASLKAMDLKQDGLIDVFDLGILTTLYGRVY